MMDLNKANKRQRLPAEPSQALAPYERSRTDEWLNFGGGRFENASCRKALRF